MRIGFNWISSEILKIDERKQQIELLKDLQDAVVKKLLAFRHFPHTSWNVYKLHQSNCSSNCAELRRLVPRPNPEDTTGLHMVWSQRVFPDIFQHLPFHCCHFESNLRNGFFRISRKNAWSPISFVSFKLSFFF